MRDVRLIAIVGLVCLTSIGFSQWHLPGDRGQWEKYAIDESNRRKHNSHHGGASPRFANAVPRPGPRSKPATHKPTNDPANSNEKHMNITDWLTGLSGVAVAFFAGLQFWVIRRQREIMDGQTKLLANAEKNNVSINRAWLAHIAPAVEIEGDRSKSIKVAVQNFGQTPAKMETWGARVLRTTDLSSAEKLLGEMGGYRSTSTIAPSQAIYVPTDPMFEINNVGAVLFSYVTYRDVFPDSPIHHTSNIWQWNIKTLQFEMVYMPEYCLMD